MESPPSAAPVTAAAVALPQTPSADPTLPEPPSAAVILRWTRPLLRARLRLPDSLQSVVVGSVQRDARDPQRFLVLVRFAAQTPFGAITPHQAWFYFRPAARSGDWVVTATQAPTPKSQ
jgi:hypothetical protein